MKRLLLCCSVLGLLLFSGCRLGPNYVRPPVPSQANWQEKAKSDATLANLAWWDLFKDETLQGLIRIALAENKDAAIALERIQQARAQLGIAKADYYPTVSGTAAAGANKASEELVGPVDKHAYYELSAGVAWELDFFGRIQRANEAQRAVLLGTEDAYRNAIILLVSEVAAVYTDLRALDLDLEISRRTLQSRKEYVDLAKVRFEGGVTPELDWRQAEAEYYRTQAIVYDFERQVRIAENQLSILLGRPPGPIPRGLTLEQQTNLPEVPAGLPSELLERRPDILAAEQQLVAENARIGEAKALMFPQISLTASYGVASNDLSTLIESAAQSWTILPRVLQTIFDAGRNKNRVRAQESVQRQAILNYQQAILLSFQEVEDALVSYHKYGEQQVSQNERVRALRQTLTLSEARYQGGVTDYLEVLDSQRSLFSGELDQVDTVLAYRTSLIRLYKALGGGWPPAPAAQEQQQQQQLKQQ